MPIPALKSVSRLFDERHIPHSFFHLSKLTYLHINKGIRSTISAAHVSQYQKVLENISNIRTVIYRNRFPRTVIDAAIIIDVHKLQLGVNEPRRIPYASGWELFKGSFFGRDSARIAQDRLSYDPEFTKDVILSLASLQGTTWNTLSEEEPGKIHHEWRSDIINGQPVSEKQKKIIEELGPIMGGNENTFTSYVSADATLAFLETIYLYIEKTKDFSILDSQYYDKEATSLEDIAHKHTLRYAMKKATEWVVDTIIYGPLLHNRSRLVTSEKPRLFSWQHMNDKGVHNQTLRDSEESEFHPNGEKANQKAPRIDTGMQGIAYDVLKNGGELFGRNDWKNLARFLQTAVLELLWMPDKQYFAQGLDYDNQTGQLRQLQTLCATVGELLNSDILLDLPENSSKRYIEGIVRMLFSREFLTSYGIRTQGLGHINALQVTMPNGTIAHMAGYHGPETVWPVINGKISDGLEHVGLFGLADTIKIRMSNTFQLIGYHTEFINVGEKEQLGIDEKKLAWGVYDPSYQFPGTNTPELIQGWSWSLHEKVQYDFRKKKHTTSSSTWKFDFERELLNLHRIKPIKSSREIKKIRSSTVISPINISYGRAVQQQLFQKWGAQGMVQLYK